MLIQAFFYTHSQSKNLQFCKANGNDNGNGNSIQQKSIKPLFGMPLLEYVTNDNKTCNIRKTDIVSPSTIRWAA